MKNIILKNFNNITINDYLIIRPDLDTCSNIFNNGLIYDMKIHKGEFLKVLKINYSKNYIIGSINNKLLPWHWDPNMFINSIVNIEKCWE